MEVSMSLQNIRFRIMNLPVDDNFRMLLLGDINLAIYHQGYQDIPAVLEYLSLLIGRISIPAPRYAFQNGHLNLLLREVYSVMQALISAPYQAKPANSPEPAGLKHSRAIPRPPVPKVPQPVCQEPTEPAPVELEPEKPMEQEPVEQPVEQEPMEQEPVEQPIEQEPMEQPVEQEPMEQEPVEQPIEQEPMEQEPVEEPVEQEPAISETPTNIPEQPKGCLRWNFPVSPSR